MKINKIKKDIFLIENFLTPEECQAIIDYLEWQVEKGYLKWNQISFYGSLAMGYWPSDLHLQNFGLSPTYFSELKERIKNACSEVLEIEMSEISFHAQKWIEGAFADYHSDNSDNDGNPSAFERSKYAAFAYLNEDFEGGLLNFKGEDNLTITPKIGLLAIFAGGHENLHQVTTITKGERYTVGSFWDNAANEYTEEQRQRWADELAKVRAEQEDLYVKWAEDASNGNPPKLYE